MKVTTDVSCEVRGLNQGFLKFIGIRMFKIYSSYSSTCIAYSTIAKLKLKLVYSLRLRFLKKRRRDVTYSAHDQHSTYTIKYNIQCIHISHCYFNTSTSKILLFKAYTRAPYFTILLVLLQYRCSTHVPGTTIT